MRATTLVKGCEMSTRVSRQGDRFSAHGMAGLSFLFDDAEMDSAVYFVANHISSGCAEIGEVLYAASQMRDGDFASFTTTWRDLAQRVEQRAHTCLSAGHQVSAADAFLRAARYYYAPIFWTDPRSPQLGEAVAQSQQCFRSAGSVMNPVMETIAVPFEGKTLPGYFWPAEAGVVGRKTLLAIGGGESWCEWMYFVLGADAHRRGYNFMTVDLPGQGSTPDDGLYYRPDFEVPMTAVIDYALTRPEVDPDTIAVFGQSMGGFIVTRAAMYEKRIAAAIGNAVSDSSKLSKAMRSASLHASPAGQGAQEFKRNSMRQLAWRMGVQHTSDQELTDTFATLLDRSDWTVDTSQITCPLLSVIGQWEYEATKQAADEVMADTAHPQSRLIVTPYELGAAAHSEIGNQTVLRQETFDWLDDVFDKYRA